MQKRFIIAILLSFVTIILFNKLFPQYHTTAPQKVQHQALTESQEAVVDTQTEQPRAPKRAIVTAEPHDELFTTIETNKFILTFSTIGGSLRKIVLKENSGKELVTDLNDDQAIGAILETNYGRGLDIAPYRISREPGKLIYSLDDASMQFRLVKEYVFNDQSDVIRMDLFIDNKANKPIPLAYTIMGPSRIQQLSTQSGRNFVLAEAKVNGDVLRKASIKGVSETIGGIISWVALKNRYYTIAMQTPGDTSAAKVYKYADKKLAVGVETKTRTIQSGVTANDSYRIYIGPIAKSRLDASGMDIGEIEHYGFFGPISKLLLTLLGSIEHIVKNWGVAIILVTLLVNIILFPLTKKSFVSMKKMQDIQPHMEKLREVHKDNPQKLNKEIMELYKTYNVNPFGGCLPMFLQLPIFFAFYQALLQSFELKNAHFLWIKDLSEPDALFTFQHALPFLGSKLNILPLITMLAMVAQQKLSSASAGAAANSDMAKQQKIMAVFFPIFFCFILYNFPSGLVLYWLTNSLLMTGEQYMLKKQLQAAGK